MSIKTTICKKIILPFLLLAAICNLWGQQLSDVPIITVLDFASEDVSKSEARLVISMLSTSLFKTGRFKVIDVSQRDTLAKELSFSMSGCSDESCQLELGRMLAAELIVVGTIGKIGSRYVLSSKILETSTGATYGAEDGVYANLDALVDDLDTFVGSLASSVIATLDQARKAKGQGATAQPAPTQPQPAAGTPGSAVAATTPAATAPTAAAAQPAQPAAPETSAEEAPASEVPAPPVKKERQPREPRQPRERPVREHIDVGVGGPVAIAGGLVMAGIGGLDFTRAGWSGTERLSLATETYTSAAAGLDNAYRAYQTEYAAWKEKAAWGIGWTAGGAALTGLGLYLSLADLPDRPFKWPAFFLGSGGAASTLFGAELITQAAGSLTAEVERAAAAYEDASADFDTLYADYLISMSERSSALWRGVILSAGGLASLGTGIILGVRDSEPAAFHWPGFILLSGGVSALGGCAWLLAEAAGPLTLAVDRSSAIYLADPEDHQTAYTKYLVDSGRRKAAAISGISLGAAGLCLSGLGVWQYFFAPVPESCDDWTSWLFVSSGLASMAWGGAELLVALLSITPEVEAAAEAYTRADSDFDSLYGAYSAACVLRGETLLTGAILTGVGLAAEAVGIIRLATRPAKPAAEIVVPLSWVVLPAKDGFSVIASWSR